MLQLKRKVGKASKYLLLLVTISIMLPLQFYISQNTSDDPLSLTVSTDSNLYFIREIVNVQGYLKEDDSPISNGLVGIEIRDPSGLPVIFRTKTTGNVSTIDWPVRFTNLFPCDSSGTPKYSFLTGETLWIGFTVKNFDDSTHHVLIAITAYDGLLFPFGAWFPLAKDLEPGESVTVYYMATKVPAWAYPGTAIICASIFSAFPKNGGTPYCAEEMVFFEIKRNPYLTYLSNLPEYPQINGTYVDNFRLPPNSKPGEYTIYVTASNGYLSIQNSTEFSVKSVSSPPQASFTYMPLEPYVNMSVTFDASSSTAEGYNDSIVLYEWNFGDGTPKVVETDPTTTHVFTEPGTYIVTLNVTDSEGLWCITSKPIYVKPPSGPTAQFTWTPPEPPVNYTVIFDASASLPGWNGTAETPIVSYEWDFGDGNITTVSTPTIAHVYTEEGNYTVTLTVTDTQGLQDTQVQIITVVPAPQLPGDINGDGTVNFKDAILLGAAFGSQPGDPNWNPNADINGDNIVNFKDAIILGANFGSSV